jgi:hypothetical protein
MFHLNGVQRNLQNIVLFCQQKAPGEKFKSRRELKAAYNRALAGLQASFTVTDRPEPEWVTEVGAAAQLAGLYKSEGGLFPLNDEVIAAARLRQDPANVARRIALTTEAMGLLRRGNPPLAGLFDLAINRLFFFDLKASGGGSSGNAIGIIWANPQVHWSALDVAEFLVHELTHNLLFLEEAVHGLFESPQAMQDPKHFARSAILRVPRRLDLCIHSLLVGVELLLARRQWLGHARETLAHPPSPKLLADCRACLDSIYAVAGHAQLLSANGRDLLARVGRTLTDLAAPQAA